MIVNSLLTRPSFGNGLAAQLDHYLDAMQNPKDVVVDELTREIKPNTGRKVTFKAENADNFILTCSTTSGALKLTDTSAAIYTLRKEGENGEHAGSKILTLSTAPSGKGMLASHIESETKGKLIVLEGSDLFEKAKCAAFNLFGFNRR